MKNKLYNVKDEIGNVRGTSIMVEGDTLLTLNELEKSENSWLFERLPNSIFIVKE